MTPRLAPVCTAFALAAALPVSAQEAATVPINALVYLIETHADEPVDGLLQWELQLRARGLTAMIKASNPVLDRNPELFRRLAGAGHVIIGGYPGICWDMPYEEQLAEMAAVKERMEDLTGEPMQVFACSYSSYDESTLRAAEELGVPYVLARGTEDVRAIIHRPVEYDVGLIEVSNVEFGGLGGGSLCDISLWSRGATEEDFAQVLAESIAKAPDSMILVSHPHIGGAKAGYWEVYETALSDPAIDWQPFDEWIDAVTVVEMPYADIPQNRELSYLEPRPAVPLDQLADVPALGHKLLMFHNGEGPMCREAVEFVSALDFPVEEHLLGEPDFLEQLLQHMAGFPESEGISDDFGLFPVIFIGDRAFSGFDDSVAQVIQSEVEAASQADED